MIKVFASWVLGFSLVGFGGLQLSLAQSIDDSRGGAVEIPDTEGAAPAPTPAPRGQPRVGRKAAQKYMGPHAATEPTYSTAPIGSRESHAGGEHYLALHIGRYVSDNAYKWGNADAQTNTGSWNVGVTYRVGEWVNSMDLGIRLDFSSFSLQDGKASKISFLPVITFPDASSKFPLYFGAGAGPGVFLSQIANSSSLSFDYQLFGGVRFFELFGNTGLFLEAGLKNHFLLLSQGQFNGTFAALGGVFTF